MKTGPQLVIEHNILFQLISDVKFFEALPAGCEDLVTDGRRLYQEAVKAALGEGCVGCSTLKQILTPYQNLLGRRLAAIYAEDNHMLDLVTGYISGKRGYRPERVVLYYKETDGRTAALAF